MTVICIVGREGVREACWGDRPPSNGTRVRMTETRSQSWRTTEQRCAYLATSLISAVMYGMDSMSENSGMREVPTILSTSSCAFFMTSG